MLHPRCQHVCCLKPVPFGSGKRCGGGKLQYELSKRSVLYASDPSSRWKMAPFIANMHSIARREHAWVTPLSPGQATLPTAKVWLPLLSFSTLFSYLFCFLCCVACPNAAGAPAPAAPPSKRSASATAAALPPPPPPLSLYGLRC